MTELYLVRHGETEWSRSGQHTGTTDLELTELGRHQASRLKAPLSTFHFDAVYSSPRRRARETARLAGFTDSEIRDELAEWNYGEFEGRTSDEIREHYPDWVIWRGPVPGGESGDEVMARLGKFITDVRASEHEKVLVFAHGHSLRVLTLAWLGLPIELGEMFELGTATISMLSDTESGPKIVHWNCPTDDHTTG